MTEDLGTQILRVKGLPDVPKAYVPPPPGPSDWRYTARKNAKEKNADLAGQSLGEDSHGH